MNPPGTRCVGQMQRAKLGNVKVPTSHRPTGALPGLSAPGMGLAASSLPSSTVPTHVPANPGYRELCSTSRGMQDPSEGTPMLRAPHLHPGGCKTQTRGYEGPQRCDPDGQHPAPSHLAHVRGGGLQDLLLLLIQEASQGLQLSHAVLHGPRLPREPGCPQVAHQPRVGVPAAGMGMSEGSQPRPSLSHSQ